jgi:hypothetical protein
MTATVRTKKVALFAIMLGLGVICLIFGLRVLKAGTHRIDPRAAAIWHKHEVVFQRALQGHQEMDDLRMPVDSSRRRPG